MEIVEEFIKKSKDYVSLMEKAETLPLRDFLLQCDILLPQIYYLGLSLPDVDFDDDDESIPFPSRIEFEKSNQLFFEMLGKVSKHLGTNDTYYGVFDPIKDKEADASNLSLDLSEIYQDLLKYISEYETGKVGKYKDTIWYWKFKMQSHTGKHIAEALHPIHYLVYQYLDPDLIEETS